VHLRTQSPCIPHSGGSPGYNVSRRSRAGQRTCTAATLDRASGASPAPARGHRKHSQPNGFLGARLRVISREAASAGIGANRSAPLPGACGADGKAAAPRTGVGPCGPGVALWEGAGNGHGRTAPSASGAATGSNQPGVTRAALFAANRPSDWYPAEELVRLGKRSLERDP
jgi:hypothetical protein